MSPWFAPRIGLNHVQPRGRSSMSEQRSLKSRVVGWSPIGRAILAPAHSEDGIRYGVHPLCECSSMSERRSLKPLVVGWSPITRTIPFPHLQQPRGKNFCHVYYIISDIKGENMMAAGATPFQMLSSPPHTVHRCLANLAKLEAASERTCSVFSSLCTSFQAATSRSSSTVETRARIV